MTTPTTKIVAKVKISMYIIMIFLSLLILILPFYFGDYLTIWGYILVGIFSIGVLTVVGAFKTIEVSESAINIKYLFGNRTVQCALTDVVSYRIHPRKVLVFKRKDLELHLDNKTIIISPMIYTHVDKIINIIEKSHVNKTMH